MTKRSFFSLTNSSVFKRNSNQKVSETDRFSDVRKFHQKIDLTESNPAIMFIIKNINDINLVFFLNSAGRDSVCMYNMIIISYLSIKRIVTF